MPAGELLSERSASANSLLKVQVRDLHLRLHRRRRGRKKLSCLSQLLRRLLLLSQSLGFAHDRIHNGVRACRRWRRSKHS